MGKIWSDLMGTTPPPPPPTLLDKAWRETDGWSSGVRSDLWNEVAGLAPETRGELEVQSFNILLTGQIKAGKSSFYNSLRSMCRGKVVAQAEVGDEGKSLTKEFRIYDLRPSAKSPPLSWKICDTMGLDVAKKDDMSDVKNILKAVGGHVPDKYEFKGNENFDDENPQYISKPSVAQKAHCVAVVVDASKLSVMHKDMWGKLQYLRRQLIDKKVPTFILLTHIDKACPEVAKDVTNVFRSIQIRDLVKLVGTKLLGLPENQVFPVKNYSGEVIFDNNKDILLLYALRQMLYNAQEHLENQMASI